MTCPEHHTSVKQQWVCSPGEKHEHVIPRSEIVKGYPHPDHPDSLVVLDPSVVDEFIESRDGFAEIEKVIDASTIDPAYFEGNPYLVWPGDGGDRGFDLFVSVLRDENKAAVTTTVLSKKTRMLIFRWSEEFGCLLGHVVRFASEVRSSDVALVRAGEVERGDPDPGEVEMARTLLASLEGEFDPTDVEDTYTTMMTAAIRQAAAGQKFEPVVTESKLAGDLMDALLASIKASSGAEPRKTTRKKVKA
jgi:DNA end-binding protein Ku